MIETAKMSARGQIVIPKTIRDEIGATEDTIFTLATVQGKIVMQPLNQEQIRKDLETFREIRRNAPKLSQEEITRVIKQARQRIKDRR